MSTVVIGAGPAGLLAARRLQAAGESVVVLEAQPYVGGRTRTLRGRLLHDQPADLGASFIDAGQDRILQLCSELGLKLTPTISWVHPEADGRRSAASMFRLPTVVDGALLSAGDAEKIVAEINGALAANPYATGETVTAWSHRAGLSSRARDLWTSFTGANPMNRASRVPMRTIHPPHVGIASWLLVDGTDSVARAMAEDLDVRLDEPVRLVAQGSTGWTIETDANVFSADHVIVATPITPTLRIGFDPVLPEWKTNAMLATSMSQGGKVIGQYANGAAIEKAIRGGIVSTGGISLVWSRPLGPEDTIVLLGLMADQEDGLLRDEERALAALDELVGSVTGFVPERVAGVVQDWTQEIYAGGVVSLAFGDFPRLPAVLAQPVGTLHFAGEHTDVTSTTAMDGALRSGERAAAEVLRSL